jgi:hypothetical protein
MVVTSVDVTTTGADLTVTLAVDSFDPLLTFDLAERHHINTNPEIVAGIEILRHLPLDDNSFSVRVTLRSAPDGGCRVVWNAAEDIILKNISLTAE